MSEIDLTRVLCELSGIPEGGAREFSIGAGDWPLRGFLVRTREGVRAYVNRCPHAGHALNLRPDRFLTRDGSLILCTSHGALFEKSTGLCVAGPCAGRALTAIAVEVAAGLVLLAGDVDPASFENVEAL
ncbi:MAG: hypothetical protein CMLOHMNK_00902 [Steroidobacteraceae bacterium]|nr:hypothetical protein [Steroidobacteraceae bacterium]